MWGRPLRKEGPVCFMDRDARLETPGIRDSGHAI